MSFRDNYSTAGPHNSHESTHSPRNPCLLIRAEEGIHLSECEDADQCRPADAAAVELVATATATAASAYITHRPCIFKRASRRNTYKNICVYFDRAAVAVDNIWEHRPLITD